jgi:predicted DNA-binding transcriptional regulator YafY
LKAAFSVSEKYRLIDEYGIDCYTVSKNKELLFERDFASYDNMREWILSFGSRVTVFEPDKLQTDIITNAKNILAAYKQT